tara:strand:- start:4122 stop:4379 length:258 start_codon:yes stop_codon:yes gene_type:complete
MKDLTIADLKEMIKEAVEEGNKSSLMKVGIDLNDPINVQRDLAFSRKQREISEKITMHGRMVLMGLFLTGLGSVVLIGIKEAINK